MKTIITTIIIVLGLYTILFSTKILWKASVNEKEIATENVYLLDYLKQNELKEKPECNFNKETCLKEYSIKNEKKKEDYSIVLIAGIIVFVSGIILLLYNSKNRNSEFKNMMELALFRLTEMTIHAIYWFMIGLLYFAMQMLIKKEVSGCVVDSMFIFYVSGLTGFYMAYYYLTDMFLKNKKMIKWLAGCFVTIILGFFLAYVIPYISFLISTPNSLSNLAFFIGFIYLAFFVTANIIVGTIFKGFFNWIKIVYSPQIQTPNDTIQI